MVKIEVPKLEIIMTVVEQEVKSPVPASNVKFMPVKEYREYRKRVKWNSRKNLLNRKNPHWRTEKEEDDIIAYHAEAICKEVDRLILNECLEKLK